MTQKRVKKEIELKVVKRLPMTRTDVFEIVEFPNDLYGVRFLANGSWRQTDRLFGAAVESVRMAEQLAKDVYVSWIDIANYLRK